MGLGIWAWHKFTAILGILLRYCCFTNLADELATVSKNKTNQKAIRVACGLWNA